MSRAAEILSKISEARATEPDHAAARELSLYAVNHGGLYRQHTMPVINNLQRKVAKGTYDHAKAHKLWGHVADHAAQLYGREHGGGGMSGGVGGFNKATRMVAAKHLQDNYDEHVRGT